MKFEESGLLADFFGYSKVQLSGSTKYICKLSFSAMIVIFVVIKYYVCK